MSMIDKSKAMIDKSKAMILLFQGEMLTLARDREVRSTMCFESENLAAFTGSEEITNLKLLFSCFAVPYT